MDRKQVRILSTSSTASSVEDTRHKQTRTIPTIIVDYNKGMGGIVRLDDRSIWSRAENREILEKVVFHLISRTTTNAYIIYATLEAARYEEP